MTLLEARPAPSLSDRVRRIRDGLATDLIEREVPVRLVLLAALAGEHVLLLGPPGTAKSELARRLHRAFSGATYFERLLTRFSLPEELFGPLSIKALEQDRYERQTEHYLPAASIAFLDEIFKANSAILNALLTLLNEREFDNGTTRVATPLISVVAASNELPEGEELAALFDRFLVRFQVAPVSDRGFETLLGLRGSPGIEVPRALSLDANTLREIREVSREVAVGRDVIALLTAFRGFLAAEKITVSDRRWRKIVGLLQVAAWTNGRSEASPWDCWLLEHCAWETPEQAPKIAAWYNARVGAAAVEQPEPLMKMLAVFETKLAKESAAQSQAHDREGHALFQGNAGHSTDPGAFLHTKSSGGDPLYYHPEDRTKTATAAEIHEWFRYRSNPETYLRHPDNAVGRRGVPLLEPTRYSEAHVRDRVDQITRILTDLQAFSVRLDQQIEKVNTDVRHDLWIPPGFEAVARARLDELARQVSTLTARAETLKVGFAALPRIEE